MNPDEAIKLDCGVKRDEAILKWFQLTSHLGEEAVRDAIDDPVEAYVMVMAFAFEAGRYREEMEPDQFESGNRFQLTFSWIQENARFAVDQFEPLFDAIFDNPDSELAELIGYLVECTFEAGRMFEVENPGHPKGVNAYI